MSMTTERIIAYEILNRYIAEYDYLFESHKENKKVAGEEEAMEYAENWMNDEANYKIFKALVDIHQDLFTSDRECMALGFALEYMGM